jgi:hypothetical protein
MLFLRVSALVFFCAAGAGCATITGKSSDVVRLYTTPPYAQAVIDEEQTVGANSTIELDRTTAHKIAFKKSGYVTQEIRIAPQINSWTYGNLILGPAFFVGLIVDLISGDITQLATNDVRVSLRPIPGTKAALRPPDPALKSLVSREDRAGIVAVMPLDVGAYTEIGEETQLSLTDQLRVFLGMRGLRVIDRGMQERALEDMLKDEQARSYAPCVDESCQVPLGRALAATHILRSTIARFGRTCSTSAELIDLSAEVTVRAASVRSGCADEALLEATERLVAELYAGAGDP